MEATNLAEEYQTPLLDWGRIQGFDFVVAGEATLVTDVGTVEPGGATRWRF